MTSLNFIVLFADILLYWILSHCRSIPWDRL